MYGPDILVCPKTTQKFIQPAETIKKKTKDSTLEVTNEGDLPIYEILPMFPEVYYDW